MTTGLSDATLEPFVSNMHVALWVLAATSLVGRRDLPAAAAGGLTACGSASSRARRGRRRGPCATTRRSGCCRSAGARAAGAHREYGSADLERLRLILRLKDLLGLSLDELREVMRGEDARAARRREWHETSDPAARTRILEEAGAHRPVARAGGASPRRA